METKDFESFQYASYNPRQMSDHDATSLENSMTTFGDISGITKNAASGILVTGHMRLKTLSKKFGKDRIKFRLDTKLDQPDDYGTVGYGYVIVTGTTLQFPYREVHWNEGIERSANQAANRIEADWNKEMLAQMNYEMSQMENGAELLALSGQTPEELEKLNKLIGIGEPDDDKSEESQSDKLEFRLTREQREIVEEAIGNIVATREMASEENGSKNGSALYYMARDYLNRIQGLSGEQAETDQKEEYLAA